MKPNTQRILSLVLVLSLMLPLSGCVKLFGVVSARDIQYASPPNTTVTSDSKWFNSAILGAVDSALTVRQEDDFYTAMNLSWALEQKMPEGKAVLSKSSFDDKADLIHARKMEILAGNAGTQSNIPELSTEELRHISDLVSRYAAAAADWDARNGQGIQPLRRYLDGIRRIQTMDELTAWLADPEGANFTGETFFTATTTSAAKSGMNMLLIMPDTDHLLLTDGIYKDYLATGDRYELEHQLRSILESLGYSPAEVGRLFARCYAMEGRIVDHDDTEGSDACEKAYNMDDLTKLCGAFPIRQLLTGCGLGELEEYHVAGTEFLKDLGRMYTQRNLENIKAYLTVHLVRNAVGYLNRDTFETFFTKLGSLKPEGDIRRPDEEEILLKYFVDADMGVPLQTLYIANYCTYEEKAALRSLCIDIIAAFRTVLANEEWMSDDGKDRGMEKLDAIRIRTLYPDTFDSYLGLNFAEDDDLMTMVQKVRAYEKRLFAAGVNTPVNAEVWNLHEKDTTEINASYYPGENSINILAGYMASGDGSLLERSYEVVLAKLGTVIGHEVTHGFDTNGVNYDKDGGHNLFLGASDATQFDLTAQRLKNYFGTFPIWPGGEYLKGSTVSGEAIADMGGMRIALRIAENIADFDYDLFFRAYAENWRVMQSFNLVSLNADDVHPPVYLRVNTVVQQFEKFYETYDIQPGDGMYLAPENRVAVW